MNKVILMGRLVRDPEIREGANADSRIGRFTLAVDRRKKKDSQDNGPTADFIPCVAFNEAATFLEKYVKKGTKLTVVGRIQTGSYTNRDNQKVYTTDVVIEEMEFAESKSSQGNTAAEPEPEPSTDGFIDVSGVGDELPFK